MIRRLAQGASAEDFSLRRPDGSETTLGRMTREGSVLLFFLRYAGCPVCQMTLHNLAAQYPALREAGFDVAAVMQTAEDSLTETAAAASLPFPVKSDPEGALFERYGVGTVPPWRYLTPSVIRKAMQAKKKGFSHGRRTGKELQAPAVFIVDRQLVIRYAYYGKNIGDLPEAHELLARGGA